MAMIAEWFKLLDNFQQFSIVSILAFFLGLIPFYLKFRQLRFDHRELKQKYKQLEHDKDTLELEKKKLVLEEKTLALKEDTFRFERDKVYGTLTAEERKRVTQELTGKPLEGETPEAFKEHVSKWVTENLEELREELEVTKGQLAETKDELSGFLCPTCGAPWESVVPTGDWEFCREFACGYVEDLSLCPKDPRFPSLQDFRFEFQEVRQPDGTSFWYCFTRPKTWEAKLIKEFMGYYGGHTKEEAFSDVLKTYYRIARVKDKKEVDLSEVETVELKSKNKNEPLFPLSSQKRQNDSDSV